MRINNLNFLTVNNNFFSDKDVSCCEGLNMRYVAAALLCGLAGGEVNAAAIGKILKAAGVDADSAEVGNFFSIWFS